MRANTPTRNCQRKRMTMRVLLTGGTGYIGAAVLDRLISGGH